MGVFSFRKNGTDSVNLAGSGNIKFLAKFPGNDFEIDFEIFNDFLNCVGGILVCRCFNKGCFFDLKSSSEVMPPTQTIKRGFRAFSSQKIGSSLV